MRNSSSDNLIIRYLSKSANFFELDKLSKSLCDSNFKIAFHSYAKINYIVDYIMCDFNTEKEKEKFLRSIKNQKSSNNIILNSFFKYGIAAVLILLLCIPFIISPNQENVTKTIKQEYITPGTDKATLTLENNKEISLVKGQKYNTTYASSDGEHLSYNTNSKASATNKITYNYLTIPKGGQFFVQLSDGSKVWLNSDSKLKYPVSFIKGIPREVELLYGEAYFEVAKSYSADLSKTFTVKTKQQKVEVLGTAFNINAYNDQDFTLTTLVEGKVNVTKGASKRLLTPGQQSKTTSSSSNFIIKEVDISSVIAWKNGFFSFENESLESMLKTLARWYSITVIYDDPSKKELILSGVLKRTNHIEALLLNIQKTGLVTFEINQNKIIVK